MAVKKQPSRIPLKIEPFSPLVIEKNPLYANLVNKPQLTGSKIRKQKRDQARTTMTIDMPAALIEAIKSLSVNHGVTYSQIACFLLISSLNLVEDGSIDISKSRIYSRSLRFDYTLIFPPIPKIALENTSEKTSHQIEIDEEGNA